MSSQTISAHSIIGFEENPTQQVQHVFEHIANSEMAEQPFALKHIPVKAERFQLFEGQWVGALLTPWMLSIIILPGPQQEWDEYKVGDKVGLKMPFGEATFIANHVEGLGQYLACSLMSPLDPKMGVEDAFALTKDVARLAVAIPMKQQDEPVDPSRRRLFSAKKTVQTEERIIKDLLG